MVRKRVTTRFISTLFFFGYASFNFTKHKKKYSWFCRAETEKEAYNSETPVLIWLNGGPGASSETGLLAENLGPQKIDSNGALENNDAALTKQGYHLLVIDNPVGSGYSYTSDESYVTSEEEMRTQFVYALRQFFAMHKEFSKNPLRVTGESYAARYVPNVALEIAVNATEIPLQGVVIGNGIYNMATQVPTMSKAAFGAGLLDYNTYAELEKRQMDCLKELAIHPDTAGVYCENVTTHWLFSDEGVGELFYYDIGLSDATFFDDLTVAMGKYLNRDDVKVALHSEGANWTQSDEKGPVADALGKDWAVPSDPVVESLLDLGYVVRMYNGVRDMSSCNHIGNLQVALDLEWSGASEFSEAQNRPWPSAKNVMGYIRGEGQLKYATVLRTGHLVPTVVPESYSVLLKLLLTKD